ncbi:MAG: hypothetical protein VX475_15875 [Myxococcota bacterium]|nr:hypothetical protein [Myxococcota bacterium]
MSTVPQWRPGDLPLRAIAAVMTTTALVCLSLGARLIVGCYLMLTQTAPQELDVGGRSFFFALSGMGLLVFAVVLLYLSTKLGRKEKGDA